MEVITFSNVISSAAFALAAWNWFYSTTDKRNDRLVREAILTLERAYEALIGEERQIPPPSNRLNWLTTARLLESYSKLKNQIFLDDTQKLVLAQNEEHWRHKFYLALESLTVNFGYYQGGSSGVIEKRSALVVIAFSNWPEGKVDEIDQLKLEDLINDNETALKIHAALRMYIKGNLD
ncbi:hypothetical protein [Herbaspirillum sp.]|jgi:hypothetical protein|uniref:hypothetical protein n=1 Tax=Herbaspirillum TaxID=963 RepID=UPI002587A5F8|nr:hypothetical protein [Herbaspirillum sp.]MCP3658164.1 hypothetical protein [Herbaspirillum sp.]MCP3950399.1 hypothetical protein [Herbaspirillum sp.]MCP4033517.1 hypothetical protein [Herbaspirillum sp.]MCP4554814.1 hypothetical protein [Herbaspirillum sp.]